MKMTPEQIQGVYELLVHDSDIRSIAAPPAHEMTHNHYSHYMGHLPRLAAAMPMYDDTAADLAFWADVLIAAGGNEQGIRDALKASM